MDASFEYKGDSLHDYFHDNKKGFEIFVVSFTMIGILWTAHDRVWSHVGKTSPLLRRLNLFWLLMVVILPVVMNLVTVFGTTATYHLYGTTIFLAQISVMLMHAVVKRDKRLWKHGSNHPFHRTNRSIQIENLIDSVVFAAASVVGALIQSAWMMLIVLFLPVIHQLLDWKYPNGF